MYNIKIFPAFQAVENASAIDKQFLEEIVRTKEESGASYVNFSAYNYKPDAREPIHFVTYPIDWITSYVKNQYFLIDPLFQTDFRRVAAVNWQDIYKGKDTLKLFRNFKKQGLGDQGLTLASHIDGNLYGVVSYIYRCEEGFWQNLQDKNMELLRFLGERLSRRYEKLYDNSPARLCNITKREKECLFWVAMGKTDEQIGETLCIGKWTVVSHLKSAKHKLSSSNRASAVAMAMALGIIDIRARLAS